MDQNSKTSEKSPLYFKYMMIILVLVMILDNYSQFYSSVIPSKVVEEFLGNYPQNVANSIFAFSLAVASLGSYIVFLVWYSADRVGRKFLLVLSVFGIAFASLGILLSRNIFEYTIFRLILGIFVGSDMWLIYISEESPPEKKAFYINVALMGGMIGILLMAVFRSIYITDTSPVGAWRGMTYFSIILGIPLGILVLLTIKETSKYEEIKESRLTRKERTNLLKKNLNTIFKSDNRKPYLATLIVHFIWTLNGIYYSLAELYMAQSPFLKEGDINIVVLILVPSIMGGFLITGIFADRIGRKPLLYVYIILFFGGAIVFLVGVNTPGIALILVCIGQAMINVAYWGTWVLNSIIIIELVQTDARGTGTGIKSLIGTLAGTTGLIITGIITYFFSLFVVFVLFVILLLINLPLIYMFMIETRGTDLSQIKQ
jgi:MFS family permease